MGGWRALEKEGKRAEAFPLTGRLQFPRRYFQEGKESIFEKSVVILTARENGIIGCHAAVLTAITAVY